MEKHINHTILADTTTPRSIMIALTSALAIALAWVVIPLALRIKKSRAKLSAIPGPRSTSWLLGNLREYNDSPRDLISDEWMEQFGYVVRIHGFCQVRSTSCRLYGASTLRIHLSTQSVDTDAVDYGQSCHQPYTHKLHLFHEARIYPTQPL